MSGKKSGTNSSWTDPDDAPELTDEWFAGADLYRGNELVTAAAHPRQETVSIRLDADVLAYFRAAGPGWRKRINTVLRRAAGF